MSSIRTPAGSSSMSTRVSSKRSTPRSSRTGTKVPEEFKRIGQIGGKQYFVPWDWGFTSVLYRTDKITTPVDTWAALLDPKYKGHISMWDDGPGAVTTSSYIHGWDETTITPDQLDPDQAGMDRAARPQPPLLGQPRPDLVAAMKSGEVWLAYAWQGAYATFLGKSVPVAYANPEGRTQLVGRRLRHPQGHAQLRPRAAFPRRQARRG